MKYNSNNQNIIILTYLLLITKSFLASSSFFELNDSMDSVLTISICALLFLKLISQKMTIKEIVCIGALSLSVIYSSVVVHNFYLAFSIVFICALKGVNIRKLLSYGSIYKIFWIAIHVSIFFIYYLTDRNAIHIMERKGVYRVNFMLGQPNTCQMYILWTTFEIFYVFYEKLKPIHVILGMAINFLFYLGTNSNTSLEVLLVTSLLILLDKSKIIKIDSLLRKVVVWSNIVVPVILGIIVANYSTAKGVILIFFQFLNNLFTGRIAYGAYWYHLSGFTLLGAYNELTEVTQWNNQWYDALYLDSTYLWLILSYGCIYVVIIQMAFCKFEKVMRNKEKIFLVAWILYAIMESYALDISKCFPLIIIGAIYYDQRKQRKNKGAEWYEDRDHNVSCVT